MLLVERESVHMLSYQETSDQRENKERSQVPGLDGMHEIELLNIDVLQDIVESVSCNGYLSGVVHTARTWSRFTFRMTRRLVRTSR